MEDPTGATAAVSPRAAVGSRMVGPRMMRRAELADLAAFVVVAENRNFRGAASRLGVTPSALSHTIRQLEERLDIRLLNRTTRSVSLTDAGMRMLARLQPALGQIAGALDDLNEERQRPFGHLKICAIPATALAVIAPIWERYLSMYPDVQLEISVHHAPVDIVAKGFDAGLGMRELAASDMIAVPVTGPMPLIVVGAPTYFARCPPPRTPDNLAEHSCIQYRRFANGSIFEWPFSRNGESRQVKVEGRVTVNDPGLATRAAIDGLGITITIESIAEPFLRSGQLVRVLDDWSTAYDGFYLYYPSRRQVPAALRAFIDTIRSSRPFRRAGVQFTS